MGKEAISYFQFISSTELRIILFGSSSSLTVRQRQKAFTVYKSEVVPQVACWACDYSHACSSVNCFNPIPHMVGGVGGLESTKYSEGHITKKSFRSLRQFLATLGKSVFVYLGNLDPNGSNRAVNVIQLIITIYLSVHSLVQRTVDGGLSDISLGLQI